MFIEPKLVLRVVAVVSAGEDYLITGAHLKETSFLAEVAAVNAFDNGFHLGMLD